MGPRSVWLKLVRVSRVLEEEEGGFVRGLPDPPRPLLPLEHAGFAADAEWAAGGAWGACW